MTERPDLDRAVEAWSRMNDASPLRSVAAVILGFVVLTLGSVGARRLVGWLTGVGVDGTVTSAFIAANLATGFLLAMLAGYLTGRAAPRAPRLHAGVLAGVLVFFSIAAISGLRASGGLEDPTWYPTAMLFVGPVGVVVGGALRKP